MAACERCQVERKAWDILLACVVFNALAEYCSVACTNSDGVSFAKEVIVYLAAKLRRYRHECAVHAARIMCCSHDVVKS